MSELVLLAPRGAEAAAVRRGAAGARVIAHAAGAAAGALPAFAPQARLVSLGLCGALSADLRAGEVVVYRSVRDAGGTALATDPARWVLAALEDARPVAGAVSARVLCSLADKRAAARDGSEVVDMESAALLRALPPASLTIVRVVCDDALHALPPLEAALRADGKLDAVALAAAFTRAPLAGLRLARAARRALRVLARTAAALSAAAPA